MYPNIEIVKDSSRGLHADVFVCVGKNVYHRMCYYLGYRGDEVSNEVVLRRVIDERVKFIRDNVVE